MWDFVHWNTTHKTEQHCKHQCPPPPLLSYRVGNFKSTLSKVVGRYSLLRFFSNVNLTYYQSSILFSNNLPTSQQCQFELSKIWSMGTSAVTDNDSQVFWELLKIIYRERRGWGKLLIKGFLVRPDQFNFRVHGFFSKFEGSVGRKKSENKKKSPIFCIGFNY